MNEGWRSRLVVDPVPLLLESRSEAVRFFARRDLLGEKEGDERRLWELPSARKLIEKQRQDGSWKYPSSKALQRAYDTLQTYRTLGDLVEKYAFDSRHQAVRGAVDSIFSSQSDEGDIRGIYGPQYSPNYTAGMVEITIKAGFEWDNRVEKALDWLFSVRQDDGGWAIPIRTVGMSFCDSLKAAGPVKPDRKKRFSHLVTGIVLRAFAAHPRWREDDDIRRAGELLVGRFFKSDVYADRRTPSYWESVSYPFCWTDILSSLDTVSRLGMERSEPNVKKGLDWLASKQKPSGYFGLKLLAYAREPYIDDWIVLAASRVFSRLCSESP
ncbi:MAG: hypothetical protein LUO79_03150 [Methanomassiliicoccales archaeon]|nr:hypothetical protein [Methanomassiliicoccales archaeon]